MASEVGSGQVAIFPVFKGFRSKVNTEVVSSGQSGGRAFERAFSSSTGDLGAGSLKKLQANVATASKSLSKSRLAEQDATGKVRIAEAALAEARSKGGAASARAVAAEERLASANRKLTAAQQATTTASHDLSIAQGHVVDATREAGNSAQSAASRYASGWAGLKQRLTRTVPDAVQDSTSKAAKVADDGGKQAGGKFAVAFKGALGAMAAIFAAGQIKDFFGSAISESANLEQSVGAIDAVFKKSSGQMQVWSKGAAQTVGLTKNEYNELGTLIGAQLKNGGTAMDQLAPQTNKLIGLGADLSSMFGGTSKEAVEALSSALKGERDPIEKYGVSLNDAKIKAEAAALGFKAVGGNLSDEAKQAATLSLIMKQTTDAHGNFAKEAATFEGQKSRMAAGWTNIKASIGDKFLPVLTQAALLINTHVLPAIAGLVDRLDFGAIGTQLAPLTGFFTEVKGGFTAMVAAFMDGGNDVTSSGLAGFFERFGLIARAVFDALGPLVMELAAAFGPLISQVIGLMAQFSPLAMLFQILQPFLPVIAAMLGQIGLAIAQVLAVVLPLAQQLVGALLPIIMQLISGVLPIVVQLIGVIIGALMPLIQLLGPILTGVFNALLPVVTTILGFIATSIQNFVTVITGIIKIFTAILTGDWSLLWEGLLQVLGGFWSQIQNVFATLPELIMNAFSGIGGWLIDSGKALIQGFIDGILGMAGAIGNAVGGLLEKARDFFPFSPAKKGPFSGSGYTTHSGKAMAGDFADAMAGQKGAVKSAASTLMGAAALTGGSVAVGASGVVGTAGGSAGVEPRELPPINIYPSEGMDEEAFAQKVRRIIEELLGRG